MNDEEGGATIAITGVIVALLSIALVLMSAASVYAQKSQLQGVADLSALAGADQTPVSMVLTGGTSEPGCAAAVRVAQLNDAAVDACESLPDGDVRVAVSRTVPVMGVQVRVRAKARAGPLLSLADLGT